MANKPIIGVTSNLDCITALSNKSDEFLFVRSNYLNVIIENGGIPVVLNNQINHQDITSLVSRLDGVLLIGGQDLDSRCYNEQCEITYSEEIHDSGKLYLRSNRDKPDYQRDLFEIELYNQAKKQNIPVLGICRGYQLINVAEGGSLYQEIPETHITHNIINETVPTHKVNIAQNTLAHRVFNSDAITTCSIHHQGIKDLGKDLIASGHSEDNLIEMIEHADNSKFIFGIQGHPERAYKDFKENNLLFNHFLNSCKKNEN